MRFHAVRNQRARTAACHGVTRAGARSRTVTLGVLAVAASGLVMTACGSQNTPGAASSSGSPGAPSAAACVTSELKISLTATGALAGQATRLGHLQASMFGAWHYTAPPPVVTLQPGNSAYAIVAADDKPAGSSSRCPAPYTRLKVSPPGDPESVTISAWLPGAVSYLPACTAADGSPTAGTSTVTTLSSLPH